MNKSIEQKRPIDLPLSFQELYRAGKPRYNLLDDVEGLLGKLYDDSEKGEHFRELLFAGKNGEFTVSGRVDIDDFMAAQMIQQLAITLNPDSVVALAKLGTILKAFRSVKGRRYPELRRVNRLPINSTNGQEAV